MRRRPVKAERITENTLIRVAIDLLLAHADELRGSTEDELRESVTSELAHSRTSGVPNTRASAVAYSRGVEDPKLVDSRSLSPRDGHGARLSSDPAVVPQVADSRATDR